MGQYKEKDIIGAIMGQTEGLLGDELELRKIAANGKNWARRCRNGFKRWQGPRLDNNLQVASIMLRRQ